MLVDEAITLKVKKTKLDGVLLTTLPTKLEDHHGAYVKLYRNTLSQEAGITTQFIQDSILYPPPPRPPWLSRRLKTRKFISCLHGRFYLVIGNYDKTHPQFQQKDAFTLSNSNHLQVLIPLHFANGRLVLSVKPSFITNNPHTTIAQVNLPSCGMTPNSMSSGL